LLAFAISLASGLSWGVSDFLGGLQSRRLPVLAVLAVSQPAGLVLALALLPVIGADPLPADKLALAAIGGAAGMGGLAAFYSALAMGTMSVVAPIAAMGVVVPIAYGLALGEEPGPVQLAGVVVAITGVVVLSYEEEAGAPEVARRPIILALISALGFGTFFTLLDVTATDEPGWAVVSARVGGVLAVWAAMLFARPELRGIRGSLGVLLVIGACDIAANTLFAIASTMGLLPVVAVGGSMYPAFTIALAHLVLGERLRLPQRAGVALALAGVILIAAGS
jgi:drug/metabolite transporter (DMT)-like permease